VGLANGHDERVSQAALACGAKTGVHDGSKVTIKVCIGHDDDGVLGSARGLDTLALGRGTGVDVGCGWG
jgi:hypothetical protein